MIMEAVDLEERTVTGQRDRILGQARADLVALPDLVAELARLVADKNHDVSGYGGKVIGSPAPLQLPVVHLVGGGQHRPAWHGEDPRQARWALTLYARDRDERTARTTLHPTEDAAWRAFHRQTGLPAPLEVHQVALARITRWRARDQYGADALLESWVRVLTEELPEYPDLTEHATVRSEVSVLLEHWAWIGQQEWAEELAADISRLTSQVRAALGQRPEQTYRCPQCMTRAYLVVGGILSCQLGHDNDVRTLEAQQRRRPQISTKDVVEEFGVTEAQLWQWKHRRRVVPTKDDRGRLWWWPWDVFCQVNPDIAEAIERRDEVAAVDHDQAQAHVP